MAELCHPFDEFQHTAARRRLACDNPKSPIRVIVSTHSRPKAAGFRLREGGFVRSCFNTQPPEGGWSVGMYSLLFPFVSTHSRPKAAGLASAKAYEGMIVSTHSRPKAAGYG